MRWTAMFQVAVLLTFVLCVAESYKRPRERSPQMGADYKVVDQTDQPGGAGGDALGLARHHDWRSTGHHHHKTGHGRDHTHHKIGRKSDRPDHKKSYDSEHSDHKKSYSSESPDHKKSYGSEHPDHKNYDSEDPDHKKSYRSESPDHKAGHGSDHHDLPESNRGRQHKGDQHGHKYLTWLGIHKGRKCPLKCSPGEVCVAGPIDSQPVCIYKSDLKKSMKMFQHYQKKEMAAWKQLQQDQTFTAQQTAGNQTKPNLVHIKADKSVVKPDSFSPAVEKAELKKTAHIKDVDECSTSQFSQMRTRLMGWFHLLHGQDHWGHKSHTSHLGGSHQHASVKKELREHKGDKCECLKSAMWQFHQMDKNKDDSLTDGEISFLEENNLEPCMQPFLWSCDLDADGKFSSSEWCCCFANVVAPCFKKIVEIKKSAQPVTYMPRCDKEGYFMPEQCSGDSAKSFHCWCVDYNGNEYKGTDHNGRAHCNKKAIYKVK